MTLTDTKRIRIGQLMPPSGQAGGIAAAVEGLTAALRRRAGMETSVFTLEPGQSRRFFFNGHAEELAHRVQDFRPDAVHTHGLWVAHSRTGRQLAHRRHLPEIVSPHGMLDAWALRHRSWKKKIAWHLGERVHLGSCRVVHALGAAERVSIRNLGVRTPIAMIPNGVDLPLGRSAVAPPWAEAFGEEAKVLLFLGRLHAKKGLEPLLRAWAAHRADYENAGWRLALVGWDDGGYAAACEALIRDLQISRTCRWFGPVTGELKTATLAGCRAFVLPSFSEGLPIAVLEAWSHGKPVFMTAACNLPEGFAAGAAVRISTNPEVLAGELREGLLGNMAGVRLEAMGAAGGELVRSRFNWDKIATQFEALYRWAIAGGERPAFVAD
jgi:poly(glycerol-phosphate) alpha-glucosyltransferase